jgi:hypothetical protein
MEHKMLNAAKWNAVVAKLAEFANSDDMYDNVDRIALEEGLTGSGAARMRDDWAEELVLDALELKSA